MDAIDNRWDNYIKSVIDEPTTRHQLHRVVRQRIQDKLGIEMPDELPQTLPVALRNLNLRAIFCDALMKVQLPRKCSDGDVRRDDLYLVYEFLSKEDVRVLMKAGNYARLVKETYPVEDAPDGKIYPCTIIVILYHGRKLWEKPKQYFDLCADYPSEAESPWLGTIFIDVCNTDIDELLLDATAPSRLFWLSLRNESIEEIAAVMTQLGRQDSRVSRAYYFLVADPKFDKRALLEALGPEMEAYLSAYEEKIIEDSRAEGKAEGLEEGEVIGFKKAKFAVKANVFLQLLETRFGKVAKAFKPVVTSATEAQVDAWLVAILDAKDLESIFAPN